MHHESSLLVSRYLDLFSTSSRENPRSNILTRITDQFCQHYQQIFVHPHNDCLHSELFSHIEITDYISQGILHTRSENPVFFLFVPYHRMNHVFINNFTKVLSSWFFLLLMPSNHSYRLARRKLS